MESERLYKFGNDGQTMPRRQVMQIVAHFIKPDLANLIMEADPLVIIRGRGNQLKERVQDEVGDTALSFAYRPSDKRSTEEKMQPIIKMMKEKFNEKPLPGSDIIPEQGSNIGIGNEIKLVEDGKFVQFMVAGWPTLADIHPQIANKIRVNLEFSTSKSSLFVNIKFTTTQAFEDEVIYQ